MIALSCQPGAPQSVVIGRETGAPGLWGWTGRRGEGRDVIWNTDCGFGAWDTGCRGEYGSTEDSAGNEAG